MSKGYMPIPKSIAADPTLTWTAKGLYACLSQLQSGRTFSYAKQETLAAMIGVSRNSIGNALAQLTKRGLVKVTKFKADGQTFNNYTALPALAEQQAYAKRLQVRLKKEEEPCQNFGHHTTNTEKSTPAEPTPQPRRRRGPNSHAGLLAMQIRIRAKREAKAAAQPPQ